MTTLAQLINRKFAEELQFLKGWGRDRERVGAILPTSRYAARRMADVVDLASCHPVLELGAGTGSITRAILAAGVCPSRLVSVEYSEDFCQVLRNQFPEVKVLQGDAFDLDSTLGDLKGTLFDCVLSALPLLNIPMPQRVRLLTNLLARIPRGRPVVQISYGPMSPISNVPEQFVTEHHDVILRNVPPAQLWVYRRPPIVSGG